jgi:Cu/Zn superoxide dismutase
MAGLKPNATYSNHVHNGLCSEAGGNHYLHDIHGADNAVNGMFPVFTSDSTGFVRYELTADKVVRPDARSIVIHEPGSGAKIACADLE